MPDKIRPSHKLIRQTAASLINDIDWRPKVSGWLQPIYYKVTSEDIAQISVWRNRYIRFYWAVKIFRTVNKFRRDANKIIKYGINSFEKLAARPAAPAEAKPKPNQFNYKLTADDFLQVLNTIDNPLVIDIVDQYYKDKSFNNMVTLCGQLPNDIKIPFIDELVKIIKSHSKSNKEKK